MDELNERKIDLTIIVAIYNIKEKILRECLDSIVANVYDGVEIILGDDGSNKETGDICREYAAKDSSITYFRQENGGLSSIRNSVMRLSKGRYIAYIDGDDVIPEGYSECIINALRQSDKEYDILVGRLKVFKSEIPQIKANRTKIVELPIKAAKQLSVACITGGPSRIEEYGVRDSTSASVCMKLYRSKFLFDNNLYFKEGLRKSEDVVFNSRSFYFCKNLGYIPEIVNFYRMNPDSLTHKYTPYFEELIGELIGCDEENMKLYDNNPEIKKRWQKYKLIQYALNNFELNIFHKNNPKSAKVRHAEFENFKNTEPFKTFFDTFDFENYPWNERRLILKLAAKGKFKTLDCMYKHPISFKVYGKVKKIFGKKRS